MHFYISVFEIFVLISNQIYISYKNFFRVLQKYIREEREGENSKNFEAMHYSNPQRMLIANLAALLMKRKVDCLEFYFLGLTYLIGVRVNIIQLNKGRSVIFMGKPQNILSLRAT